MASIEDRDPLADAIAQCGDEPIHIPGSIQPHGFLLALSEPDLTVVHASENVEHWIGVPAVALLGRQLPDLIGDCGFSERLATLAGDDHNPFHLSDISFRIEGQAAHRPLALMAHRFKGQLIVEFEDTGSSGAAYDALYPLMRTFVVQLQEAQELNYICELAVREVKRITGFGRVKAYRFDEQGNGLVLAEEADEGYPRYLGLCFPASDIPPQARQLYCNNLVRVIQDANYEPSAIVPTLNPDGQPLDLSFASLRSVSPVHLQYMRNMGTLASMSVSIVIQGKLWGLISCHDAQPRAVSYQTRTACELLARILSLQIEAKEAAALAQRKLELRRQIVELLSCMADRDSVVEGFLSQPQVVLEFAEACGGAIVSGERYETVGDTPPTALLARLTQWLAHQSEMAVFSTHNVGRDVPAIPELAEHCAGVLAIPISRLHPHYLIWFRREQVKTVSWAGQPEKRIDLERGSLSPRNSFEVWQETLRGFAEPWQPVVVEGALELRTAVLGIVLRKAEEMAQLAGELRESNKELESFSYSVSHDLRAPLRHIAGYAELLGELEGDKLTERGLRFLDNIGDAARFAGTLVDNLLSFSQMGRAALRLSDVNLTALVESIRQEMAPDCEGRQIEWRVHPMPVVIADAAFIHMALRNLISNAIKYSRKREQAVIEIGAEERAEEVIVYVRDNGVGFNMQYANKLFGVFQRLHRMEEFEGTGIGLASVRRIIERHDGQVWADGQVNQGATFFFSLPRLTYASPI
ncbi:ATP-binding protein [Stutzerimonas marianensis]